MPLVKPKALLARVLVHSNVIFDIPSINTSPPPPVVTGSHPIHLMVLFAHVLKICNVTFTYAFRNLIPLMTQRLIKLYALVPLSLTESYSTIASPFHPLSTHPMLPTPHS